MQEKGHDNLYPMLDISDVYWLLNKQTNRIVLILFLVSQKELFSLMMFHCSAKIMWKQNHTASVPQMRGVSAYFQLEFITWWYSGEALKNI